MIGMGEESQKRSDITLCAFNVIPYQQFHNLMKARSILCPIYALKVFLSY